MIGLLAGLALLVACLGMLITVLRSDDEPDAIVDAPTTTGAVTTAAPTTTPTTEPPPTAAPTTAVPTSAATTAPQTTAAPTAVPITAAPTTAAPATAAPTTAPRSSAPSTTAAVADGVLQDPLPSGLTGAEVGSSLAAAQQLADALASGDWDTARRLNPALSDLSDAEFEDGYGGLDRAALLLVDATPAGDGHDLVAVLVANELAGVRTSFYCVVSNVSGEGTVRQRSADLVHRVPGTMAIDEVRQDPATLRLIRERCGRA